MSRGFSGFRRQMIWGRSSGGGRTEDMDGETLREMRMEMGWSQAFLADRLEVTRSSLAHWEQLRAPVPWDVAKKVRKAHGKVTKIVEELGHV